MKDKFQLIAELPTVESIHNFFDRLLQSAMKYRLKNLIVPIDSVVLTEAVFGINSVWNGTEIWRDFALSWLFMTLSSSMLRESKEEKQG